MLVKPAAQSSGLLGPQIQGLVLLALRKQNCFSQAEKTHKAQSKAQSAKPDVSHFRKRNVV